MLRYFSITLVSLPILAALCMNGSDHFRMKMADHYIKAAEYKKALHLYAKVLRREEIKHHLSNATSCEISFKSGYLYSKIDMPNAVIESYARGAIASSGPDLNKYRSGESLRKDKLLAIGLLEGGRYQDAAGEFQKLKALYPDFHDADRYISAARALEERKAAPGNENFYFSIGEEYIRHRLFGEAREFYTKRILHYGIFPLRVLRHLRDTYSADVDVRGKVWGSNIYVTLEDFESAEYEPSTNIYEGHRSKVLDIPHNKVHGLSVFEKVIEVPFDKDLNAGIRLFVKCDDPSVRIILGVEATYLKARTSGISLHSVQEDAGGGWAVHKIRSLFEVAQGMAGEPRNNWSMENAFINKCSLVIWADSAVRSDKFYVDEIQLYLENKKDSRSAQGIV